MTQELSSLMDGELDTPEADRAIRSCCASEEQQRSWYLYHAIGDAMRAQAPRRLEMPNDVFESLKSQPTVLAPRRPLKTTYARIAMAAAASVATFGVVGWIGMQGGTGTAVPTVAKSGSALQPVAAKAAVKQQPAVDDVQEYLAAHRQMPSPDSYRNVNNRAATPAR
jgi:sigma-E factor negative regulatory protein RseA